jgi:hypothetical protein
VQHIGILRKESRLCKNILSIFRKTVSTAQALRGAGRFRSLLMVPVATLLYIQGLPMTKEFSTFLSLSQFCRNQGRRLLSCRFILLHVRLAGTNQTPEGETSQSFKTSGRDYFSSQFHSLWISLCVGLVPMPSRPTFSRYIDFCYKNFAILLPSGRRSN